MKTKAILAAVGVAFVVLGAGAYFAITYRPASTPIIEPQQMVTVEIPALGVQFTAPSDLSDLTSAPVKLQGDQAVNSVGFSTARLEAAGCGTDQAPLGYLTYDTVSGGEQVGSARGSALYYLSPDSKCNVDPALLQMLKEALKSVVSYEPE